MDRERLMDLIWHMNAQISAQQESLLLARTLREKMDEVLPGLLRDVRGGPGGAAGAMLLRELSQARERWEDTLGAAAVLVWAVVFSPLLALRAGDVTVTGSDGTVQAADVQRIVAAHEGISLVRLDPAAMGREVADSLVRVRAARVTRSWPHGLRVDLTMRRPIAVHEVEQGYEVLDSEAVVLKTIPV